MLQALRNFTVAFLIAALTFGPAAYILSNVVLDCVGPSFGLFDKDSEKKQSEIPQYTAETDDEQSQNNENPPPEKEQIGGDPFTILFIGTDYQPDILKDYAPTVFDGYPSFTGGLKQYSTSLKDAGSYRTVQADAIFIVKVDTVEHRIIYSCIPSSMIVPCGTISVSLNDIYASLGLEYFISKISAITGINIDYYAVLNMQAMEKIIDDVGGVRVYVPYFMRYTDKSQKLEIDLRSGTQTLSGSQAVGFMRFKNHPVDSEYSRATSAEAVFASLIAGVAGASPSQKLGAVYDAVSSGGTTDFPSEKVFSYIDVLLKYGEFEKIRVAYPGRYVTGTDGNDFVPNTDEAIRTFGKYK